MKRSTSAMVWSALLVTGMAASCVSPDLPLIQDGGASTSTGSSGGGGTGGGTSSSTGGAGGDVVTTYNDMTQAELWSTFDTTSVSANAKGFLGAAFDGRYVYLVPYGSSGSGTIARYDTQANFTVGSSWSIFDTTSVNAGAKGFGGATFDGRYIYFAAYHNGAFNGLVTRYDTQASFTAGSSWSIFDTTTVNANAKGFFGAVFDGRYVYFVPQKNGVEDGVVARYDAHASFTAAASWSTFDTTSVDANAKGFAGGVFDGRYLYLSPGTGGAGNVVARFDTQASFTAAASWSTFTTTSVNADAKGFAGAAFDGRYVYLVPLFNGAAHGIVPRYDTQGSFTAAASWTTFDTTSVNGNAKAFYGAAFDGRYLYLAPSGYGSFSGMTARYDTHGGFSAAGSWSTFDTTSVNANAVGFQGAVFDGRYLYLVPNQNDGGNDGVVARFDAKTPPSLPSLPGWSGSFF